MQTLSDTGQLPDLMVTAEEAAASLKRSANKARQQGAKEAAAQFPRLREHWPEMFSGDPKHIRPLASSVVKTIAELMGWDEAYVYGIMMVWKGSASYCRAVLAYDRRYNLDSTPSDEEVDDNARGMARARLDQIAAKKKARLAAANPQPSAGKAQPSTTSPQPSAGKEKPKAPAPVGKQKKVTPPAKTGTGRSPQRAKGARP